MIIDLLKMPYIYQDLQVYAPFEVYNEFPIILSFKRIYRDDDALLLDIYMDDISELTKIVSGKVLTPNSTIYTPNRSINFPYTIRCLDIDDINLPITPKNVHKFYLQFISTDDGNIED